MSCFRCPWRHLLKNCSILISSHCRKSRKGCGRPLNPPLKYNIYFCVFFSSFFFFFIFGPIQYLYSIPLIYNNNITNNFSTCTLMLVSLALWVVWSLWRSDRCSTEPLLSQHFGGSGLPVRLCLVRTPNCEDRGNLTLHRAKNDVWIWLTIYDSKIEL